MRIGIDPDLDKCGVAFIDAGAVVSLHALDFFAVLEMIAQNPTAEFVIEDVEFNKPTFNRGLNQSKNLKVAQNVGMVKAVARLLTEALKRAGVKYKAVPPLKGHMKNSAKKDAKYFNKITGWTGISNEDKRDAALLALFG